MKTDALGKDRNITRRNKFLEVLHGVRRNCRSNVQMGEIGDIKSAGRLIFSHYFYK